MLYQRYAAPLSLLDRMIKTGRLSEFVSEFIKIRNEETEEQTKWEFWLHKVFDMTYKDFLDKSDTRKNEKVTHDMLEATVKDSMGIIEGFCPV